MFTSLRQSLTIVAAAIAVSFGFAACARSHPSGGVTSPTVKYARVPSAVLATAKPAPATSVLAKPTPAQTKPTPASRGTAPPGSQSPLPRPAASPSASPKVVMLTQNARPRIVSVALSRTRIHPGDVVSGRVVTSSNVASVEVRVATYSFSLPRIAPGTFALTYTVPPIPFFIRGAFDLNVIARNARGDAVTRAIPIVLQ